MTNELKATGAPYIPSHVIYNRILIKQLPILIVLILSTLNVCGQQTITGTVYSKEDKKSLPGVEVVQKGTKNGTLTDINGHFTIVLNDSSSTLVFSFVGMITKEYELQDQTNILVEVKWDCTKCFFDVQQLGITANSGLINNPIGGQLELSSHWLFRGIIKGTYSYQTNLDENEFHIGQVELLHYVSNCDFDIDFRWAYRNIKYDNELAFHLNSFETDFNTSYISFIAGYSKLQFSKNDTPQSITASGLLVGIGIPLNLPLYPIFVAKTTLYKNKIEYQTSIEGGYRRLNCHLRYYKLDSFSELSIGLGYKLNYRLNKRNVAQVL